MHNVWHTKGKLLKNILGTTAGKLKKIGYENDAHKIYQGLNGGNDFKYRKAHKIFTREPRWANPRDDGLNHAGNVQRNVARRTSDNSSLGNSVR
ncbi:hypothetical protein GIB67_004982 [Kingdonia uniflora]|uniref:Uncharacterized protein n=1 Tax=Kingdonia uniflora TaxID=39325 RepID=A0A7J7NN30_9MAGN|nr:hypothetical protein GIB67_004982 [Kingdonia uniflora]